MDANQANKDLHSIRDMMERSLRFISFSGWAGILAGVYALSGAVIAYCLLYYPEAPIGQRLSVDLTSSLVWELCLLASIVLLLSIGSAFLLTIRKAKQQQIRYWNKASRQFVLYTGIPLLSGGLLLISLVLREYYGVVAPAMLVFYGLALVSGSHFTWPEVRYLGIMEILLGLLCSFLPGYGLLFWAIGFGMLHIFYGFIMYRKYER